MKEQHKYQVQNAIVVVKYLVSVFAFQSVFQRRKLPLYGARV